MVRLSFYLLEIRPGEPWRRIWLESIDHYPTDWLELKTMLTEVMETVHVLYGKTEALISLERHMSRRYTVKFSGHYGRKRIPAGREAEAFFRVEYSPEKREIVVKEANFGYHLAHLREDFKWMERGREYEVPPLIPQEHRLRNLNDPRSLLMEPSGLRYSDYSREPKQIYAYDLERRGFGYGREIRRMTYSYGGKLSEPGRKLSEPTP